MKEGSNEIMSISHLLEAVAHLAMWYEGEEAEGEVVEEISEAADKAANDKPVRKEGESDEDYDKRCKMYDEKMKNKEVDPVPTEETQADLTGTTNIAAGETAGVPFEATVTDSQARINAAKTVSVDETEVNALVEQVVKSATESLKAEIESLVAAKEAALEKSVSLEAELATAKTLAVAGGPKRTGTSLAQPMIYWSRLLPTKRKQMQQPIHYWLRDTRLWQTNTLPRLTNLISNQPNSKGNTSYGI
jgi:hypothetical protein